MDNGVFTALSTLAETHPVWLVALAFAFAFLESLAIVGILVPGIILLFLVGALIGPDAGLFVACWMAAFAGALFGDGFSYWLGWRYRDRIPALWPFRQRPELLLTGQALFERHGGKAIVLARFIGPMRPLLPLIAGSMSVPQALFYRHAIPACLVWAPVYLLPGMLFGASLELAAEFAGRLAILLAIVVLGIWLVLWVTRQIYEFTARRSGWWLKSLVRWSRAHPLVGKLVGSLLEPGRREILSVTLLGLLLMVSIAVLLTILLVAPFADTSWDASRQMAGWAASLRNHFADPVFAALALATDTRSMILLAGATGVILLALGRINAAWHWAAAVIGAWLLAELLIRLTALLVDQPEFMPTLGQVPFLPLVLATVVFGFFAVLLGKDLGARHRKWPYLAASMLVALSGFSHFYLGRASVMGLLAALALGLGWLALIGIGYRQRARPRAHPGALALAFYGLAIGTAVVNIEQGMDDLLEATRLTPPIRLLTAEDWREHEWRSLPDRYSRIGKEPRTRFDVQVAAGLTRIEQTLKHQGWQTVPEVRLVDLWSVLIGRPDLQSLPHLNRDFAGRPEELIMRRERGDGSVIVLRLWESGLRLSPGDVPVWLGQVRVARPGLFLGSLTRWYQVDQEREAAEQLLSNSLSDWWQQEAPDGPRRYAEPD